MQTKMYILTLFDKAVSLVKDLEHNVCNVKVKEQLVSIINNIVEYACVNVEDKHMLTQVMQFLVTLFYRVGELDYDSVEIVLDTLTAGRITIRELLNENDNI